MTGDGWFKVWLFAAIGLGATAGDLIYSHLGLGLACLAATFGAMFMAARSSM